MAHTVTVRTERGRYDSLQKPVKIAFTLTPITSNPSAHKPVAYKILKFGGNDEEHDSFTWDSGLGFCPYAKKLNGKIHLNDKTTASFLSPGQAVSIVASRRSKSVEWNLRKLPSDDASITAVNETGSAQRVMLHIPGPDTNKPCPIVVYRPFDHGQRIIASSTLALQAYVVSEEVSQERSLRVKDRRHPIWFSPINCDLIPAYSNWRLSQGRNGEIQIKNTQSDLDLDPATTNVDDLSRNAITMREKLISMQASIDATKSRLQTTNDVAKRNEVDISDVQTSVNATRNQLPKLDHKLYLVEARITELEASFNHVKDRLDTVDKDFSSAEADIVDMQGTLGVTHDWVNRVDATIIKNQAQLVAAEESLAPTGAQLKALGSRVDSLQVKENGLAALCNEALGDISAVQKFTSRTETWLNRLRRRVSVVEEKAEKLATLLGITEPICDTIQYPEYAEREMPECPAECTEGVSSVMDDWSRRLQEPDSHVKEWTRLDSGVYHYTPPAPADSGIREVVYSVVKFAKSLVSRPEAPGPIWPSEDKLAALTVCVSDMERRILSLKTSIADIEKGFPSVEKTVTKNQTDILALQTSLENTRDRVSALGCRLADAEARATHLDVDLEDTKGRIVVMVGTIEDAQTKIDTVNQSLDAMCDKLSIMEKDAFQAQEDAEVIDERSRSTQKEVDRLALRVDAVVGGAEALEESVAQAQRSLHEVEVSLDKSRCLVGELDRRMVAVEAKTATLTQMFDLMRKYGQIV